MHLRNVSTRHPRHHSRALAGTLAILSGTAACEGEVTQPPPVLAEGEITVDASANSFVHLDFDEGVAVVTPSDPVTSTDWHMALRRFSIRLNGGVAGPGSVVGHNLGDNSSLSAEEVAALTPADGEAAFAAVTDAHIPSSSAFVEEELVPDPGGRWFRYDPISGTLVANPGAAWKVREASGRGFAVFRVVSLEMEGQRPVGVTVEYRRHGPNGSLGEARTVAGDLGQGPVFLSLAEAAVANPAGCGWDLGLTPDLTIVFNADCGSGTFPLDITDDFDTLSEAGDAPDYAGFLSIVAGAFPATVDDAGGVFWYDIRENRRMWPTYNVFLVQVEQRVYKMQVTGYYDASGISGHVTIRYRQLR